MMFWLRLNHRAAVALLCVVGLAACAGSDSATRPSASASEATGATDGPEPESTAPTTSASQPASPAPSESSPGDGLDRSATFIDSASIEATQLPAESFLVVTGRCRHQDGEPTVIVRAAGNYVEHTASEADWVDNERRNFATRVLIPYSVPPGSADVEVGCGRGPSIVDQVDIVGPDESAWDSWRMRELQQVCEDDEACTTRGEGEPVTITGRCDAEVPPDGAYFIAEATVTRPDGTTQTAAAFYAIPSTDVGPGGEGAVLTHTIEVYEADFASIADPAGHWGVVIHGHCRPTQPAYVPGEPCPELAINNCETVGLDWEVDERTLGASSS